MKLEPFASSEDIARLVKRIASEIRADYAGKVPVMVCVLKGAFLFTADLVRMLDMEVELDFIRASSYGDGCVSSGDVCITKDIDIDIRGRHVIIIEDILDTGLTLDKVAAHLDARSPASLKICSLLDKPARRMADRQADYLGMEVEDLFVVGYGLDCAERYRNMPALFVAREGHG